MLIYEVCNERWFDVELNFFPVKFKYSPMNIFNLQSSLEECVACAKKITERVGLVMNFYV